MQAQNTYELMLSDNSVVRWSGTDGENAAVRCADCTGKTVVAWREFHDGLVIAPDTRNIVG